MRFPWQRRPPDVTIAPSIPEWEEHPADYEEWVGAARALGLRVELAETKPPHSGADLPEFVPLGFAVYIATKVADVVVDSLIAQAKTLIFGASANSLVGSWKARQRRDLRAEQ
jgi:hypothetical protein